MEGNHGVVPGLGEEELLGESLSFRLVCCAQAHLWEGLSAATMIMGGRGGGALVQWEDGHAMTKPAQNNGQTCFLLFFCFSPLRFPSFLSVLGEGGRGERQLVILGLRWCSRRGGFFET